MIGIAAGFSCTTSDLSTRTRWLNSQSSLTPADWEEGLSDKAAVRVGKHVFGHNWTATVDVSRESVLDNRINA